MKTIEELQEELKMLEEMEVEAAAAYDHAFERIEVLMEGTTPYREAEDELMMLGEEDEQTAYYMQRALHELNTNVYH